MGFPHAPRRLQTFTPSFGSLIRCCVLYSFFAPGESLTNAIILLEVWKLVGNFSPVNLVGFREKHAQSTKSTTTTATTKDSSLLFLFVLLKINLSLVVMMSAVNPWKTSTNHCVVNWL